jgi:hypothetical protein
LGGHTRRMAANHPFGASWRVRFDRLEARGGDIVDVLEAFRTGRLLPKSTLLKMKKPSGNYAERPSHLSVGL